MITKKSIIGALDIFSMCAAYKMVTSTFDVLSMFPENGISKPVIKIGKHIMACGYAIETGMMVDHVITGLIAGLAKGINHKTNESKTNDIDYWEAYDTET